MTEPTQSHREFIDPIADAIWQQIQFLARSWMQYDSFVAVGSNLMPVEKKDPESEAGGAGEVDDEQAALDFVLLTLRDVLETDNFRILDELARKGDQSAAELAASLKMNELTLQERLSTLMQRGFVVRDYDRGKYLNSPAGDELAAVIREIQTGVTRRIQAKLPTLLGIDKEGK